MIEQIYTNCLAQGAYYIQDGSEAAVIDPLRDVQSYLDRAREGGATLKYVFETHFHADFVSGHLALAEATGARIVYGPLAQTDFPSIVAEDGGEFMVGSLKLTVLHTPGHTMESTCYLLSKDSEMLALFSGDTLFIGDVGRPDLAQKSSVTQEDLAGLLYESLHRKIMPLPDSLTIYPAHGAGSSCGKNMSADTSDTLGHQKQVNYALKATTKEQFVREVTEGLDAPPFYFPENVALNRKGYPSDQTVRHLKALSVNEFLLLAAFPDRLILDTRDAKTFTKGFITGSINIGLNGDFAPWVGTLITDLKRKILLVAEEGTQEEAVRRLMRVGYDGAEGFLEGGIASWTATGRPLDYISTIEAVEYLNEHLNGCTLDVRKQSEFESGHLLGSVNIPLKNIASLTDSLSSANTYFVHCEGGYRSMIACSILKAHGFKHIVNINGGMKALRLSKPNTH